VLAASASRRSSQNPLFRQPCKYLNLRSLRLGVSAARKQVFLRWLQIRLTGRSSGAICYIFGSNHLRGRCVSAVCLLGRVEEVSLSSERDSSLRKGWVGANSNPAFWTRDYDLLPNVAVEHPGAFFVHTACRSIYRLEHGSTPIAPDSRVWIRSSAPSGCGQQNRGFLVSWIELLAELMAKRILGSSIGPRRLFLSAGQESPGLDHCLSFGQRA
jgi:hypothetical protein